MQNEMIQDSITENKECPECAETIKLKAIKCRFCGYMYEKHNEFNESLKTTVGDIRPAAIERHSFGSTFVKLNNGHSAVIKNKLIDLEKKHIVVEITEVDETKGIIKGISKTGYSLKVDQRIKLDNVKKPKSIAVSSKKEANSSTIRCPKCKSDQITSHKKGYGMGKGAAGFVLTGGVGLAVGFFGANKVKVTCLSCGNSWKAGK
jgi:predicted RNA-binding Zn-ribbon protein involved in translation (DUF1610 family)